MGESEKNQNGPLILKTIEIPLDCDVDRVLLSNNKNYMALIKIKTISKKYEEIHFLKIKLIDLETMSLIKELKNELNELSQSECEFSKDSQTFIIPGLKYYLLYYIESDECIKIRSYEHLEFSQDASRFLCGTSNALELSDNFYSNITNQKWKFSEQSNFLISFSNEGNSLQYRRTKPQQLHKILDIRFPTIPFASTELKFFEWFQSRVILIYSNKFIKIYNLQGKLIRHIHYRGYSMHQCNINDKPLLVNVFTLLIDDPQNRKIGFIILLPEIRIFYHNITVGSVIYVNINGVVKLSRPKYPKLRTTISYFD